MVEYLFVTFVYLIISRNTLFDRKFTYLHVLYCESFLSKFLAKFEEEKGLTSSVRFRIS
jgi:uncharacterized membrane protein YbaN (DUF454 family)